MPSVRIATLNLLNNPHGRWVDREPLVTDQAQALDADVYAFQEVDVRSDQVDRIVAALGTEYTKVVLANPDPASIKSLAFVTRLDVVEHDRCTTLEQGDLALRLFARAGGTSFSVTTTHFHFAPNRAGSACRQRQAEQLLTWLADDEPAVVVGDFNSQDGGGAIRTMKSRFQSAHEVVHGSEPSATHPTPLVHALDAEKAFGVPVFPDGVGAAIDFVFVDGSVGVAACQVAWDEGHPHEPNLYPSDHFGLVADLDIP